jgi:hypothetical protein
MGHWLQHCYLGFDYIYSTPHCYRFEHQQLVLGNSLNLLKFFE